MAGNAQGCHFLGGDGFQGIDQSSLYILHWLEPRQVRHVGQVQIITTLERIIEPEPAAFLIIGLGNGPLNAPGKSFVGLTAPVVR